MDIQFCVKIFLMVFNILFWATGLGLLAFGIWVKMSLLEFLQLTTLRDSHLPHIFIGLGVCILLVACLGCCCTVHSRPIFMYTYAACLCVVFVVELSIGIVLLVYADKIDESFREGLASALNRYGSRGSPGLTRAFDKLQKKLACCGLDSYRDWQQLAHFVRRTGRPVPDSCCRVELRYCHSAHTQDDQITRHVVYRRGCHHQIMNILVDNIGPLGSFAVATAVMQGVGAFMAFCLANDSRQNKYEVIY